MSFTITKDQLIKAHPCDEHLLSFFDSSPNKVGDALVYPDGFDINAAAKRLPPNIVRFLIVHKLIPFTIEEGESAIAGRGQSMAPRIVGLTPLVQNGKVRIPGKGLGKK